MDTFHRELTRLINIHSKEGESNTPDFILAWYMERCLETFEMAVNRRDRFDERNKQPDTCGPGPKFQRVETEPTETLPVPVDPPGTPRGPRGPVDGHTADCLIDLDSNYHPCTCGQG